MIPSLFVAHGSPMVAIENSAYASFLTNLGKLLPRPNAIVVFSAHWESSVQMVSDVETYSTIYDFGGFPNELYQVTYPAKGHHKLAIDIQNSLHAIDIPCQLNTERGLDHGVWTILRRMYPNIDIPVVAMSVNADLSATDQYQIGKALAPLREQNVLIIGSGVTVHNFQLFSVRHRPDVQQIVVDFENWLESHLHAWDLDSLFAYESQAPNATIAVPPNGKEHFVPLYYAMGAADATRSVHTLHRSIQLEVLTNSVYQFGD